jgi:predicted site-specific integrase-resolvase
MILAKHYQALLGIDIQTVYDWIKAGKVRAIRRNGRYYIEHPGDLDSLPGRPTIFKDPDRIPLFTGAIVCSLVGVSPRRLRQLGDAGKINFRVLNKHRRYSALDVRNYIVYKYSRRSVPYNSHVWPEVSPEQAQEFLKEWAIRLILKEKP